MRFAADAGLARVAELAERGARDGGVEVGVVEDDERRVAAELERDLLQLRRALLHQQLADRRRAGEPELAHERVRRHLRADRGRVLGGAGHHGEHARGQARLLGERGDCERRQRRLLGRLQRPSCSPLRVPAPSSASASPPGNSRA